MLVRNIIYCSELLITTAVKLWLQTTGKLVIGTKLHKKLDRSKRYVYVANHASYLDVFVMWAVLDFNQRINGAPTKVMTGPGVYFTFLRPLVWLLGAYPSKKLNHPNVHAGVDGSLHYIQSGYNICIFPEGKRSLRNEKRAFNGVSQILANSDDCEMILIRIIWQPGPWWKRRLELRASSAPDSLDHHDPYAIMEHIYNL